LLRDGTNPIAIINIDNSNTVSSMEIKNLCDTVKVPYLYMYWEREYIQQSDRMANSNEMFEYAFNIHPKWAYLASALADLIEFAKWDAFVFIYQDSSGLYTNYFYKKKRIFKARFYLSIQPISCCNRTISVYCPSSASVRFELLEVFFENIRRWNEHKAYQTVPSRRWHTISVHFFIKRR
jgi:hypothetical protein